MFYDEGGEILEHVAQRSCESPITGNGTELNKKEKNKIDYSVGRDLPRSSSQPPDQFKADQKLKHTIKGIVKMLLKLRQAWGTDHLLRKPVPAFDYSFGK